MKPHAFQPHPDGRFGCSLCPLSQHHEIHSGGTIARPPEDTTKLFYGTGQSMPTVHVGRRGSEQEQSVRARRRAA